jgi:hypothetical protein
MAVTNLMPVLQDLHHTFHDSLLGNLRAFQDTGSATAFASLRSSSTLWP